MSEVSRLQRVTRIRAELEPGPSVQRAANRFLDHPMEPSSILMFTTAQAVVDQQLFHRNHFANVLGEIDVDLRARAFASRIFRLTAPLKMQEFRDGAGRLFFNVDQGDRAVLRYVRHQFEGIEGLEEPHGEDLLYIEFARHALADDARRRREQIIEARDKINSELGHPTARHRMTAKGLHVVTKDMLYPVSDAAPLTVEE
jgi:hypothetical protein